MRVLLLHPEDRPFEVPWSSSRWDFVVDFGWAGRAQYQAWSEGFGCPVRALYGFGDWFEDVRQLQQLLAVGNGILLDSEGIDWWALLALRIYPPLFEFFLLQKVANQLPPAPELYATRPSPAAEVVSRLVGSEAKLFSSARSSGSANTLRRYRTVIRTLTPKQIAIIAGDKWDSDYRVRRFFARRPKAAAGPKILLPTAYRNVSRTVVSLAKLLPESSFLLVATRADGLLPGLPPHIQAARLAAYAPVPGEKHTEREIAALTAKWKLLQNNLLHSAEPAHGRIASLLQDLPRALRIGLRIRDTWRRVFEQESISAVLCGDENNPYTRLPVLLAKNRGIRTINSSHGALDAGIMLSGVCSDLYLVRGEMEGDYLVQGGVPRERIFVGSAPMESRTLQTPGNDIYFFSEPYELYSGRTELLYEELLANLCAVARKHGRKVIVKLHPFESVPARSAIIDRVVTPADRSLVEISAEPMSELLLRKIWFAATVESSVAVECAIAGVPCFLCSWFDLNLYAYGRQYARFGAARSLDSPADFLRVADELGSRALPADTKRLYTPITKEGFISVLEPRRFASNHDTDLPAGARLSSNR